MFDPVYLQFMDDLMKFMAKGELPFAYKAYKRNGLEVCITYEHSKGHIFTSLPVLNEILGDLIYQMGSRRYGEKFSSANDLYGFLCLLGQYSNTKVNPKHWEGQRYLPQPFYIQASYSRYIIYFADKRIDYIGNYVPSSLVDAKKHVQLLASFLRHRWRVPIQSDHLLVFSGSGNWIDSGIKISGGRDLLLYESAKNYGLKE